MKFTRTEIPDVIIIEPKLHGDERGYFTETFRQDLLENFLGFKVNFCQDNASKSSYGVLRGLHYQMPPHSQTKLVRVTSGKVLDVALDIRIGSPTFGKHVCVELSALNGKQLFVPRGFAHGFVVLSETATFVYKVDNYYNSKCETGLAFDDSCIGIDWQIPFLDLKLSEKDKNQAIFTEAEYFNFKIDLYE